ncbi:MAG: DctP family TRAP transporter solute-binding subunit [Neptuniibacter sp.]
MGRTAFSILSVIGLVLLALIFTNTKQESTTSTDNQSKSKTHVLRFGHNTPENSALHQAALLFAEKVKNKSGGELTIEVYPAQQLGNDHQMVEMARQGELDILLTPTAKLSIPVPAMQYADLPFFFPNRAAVYEMLDGEPGNMLLKKLSDIDLLGVTFWENGFKHFTGNQPFLYPDDFSSKKIRVMKSRIIMEQFGSFGAEPIAIDFHATRQALADGVVDGQENPLIAIYSMGFHEVQSDLVLSEHAYLGYVLSFSKLAIARLPFHQQELLVETAKEVTPIERLETQKREQDLIEKIQKSGVNVYRLTEQQRQQFADLTAHIPSRFEEIIGSDIISKTEELLFENHNNRFIIGLNADLSDKAGLAIKRGAQLAIREINSNGGLLGRPLQLIARDHKITPNTGLDNMKYFTEHPDVIAVVGGKHSVVIAEEMDLVQKAQIPYLIPWATSHKITKQSSTQNSIFRISANDQLASHFIARYALNNKNCQSPALVVENTIWGRGNLQNMKAYLASQSVVPSVEMIFNRGQKSYLTELKSLISTQVDCVILAADVHEGNIIIPELFGLKKELPIVSHWGILGGNFAKNNHSILNELDLSFFQTFLFNESDRPQAHNLEEMYRAQYGLSNEDDIYSQHAVAQAYDLIHLLAKAATQAMSVKRADIQVALENLPSHDGVIKHYAPAFTKDNHDGLVLKDFTMARFNEHGQIIPVKYKDQK